MRKGSSEKTVSLLMGLEKRGISFVLELSDIGLTDESREMSPEDIGDYLRDRIGFISASMGFTSKRKFVQYLRDRRAHFRCRGYTRKGVRCRRETFLPLFMRPCDYRRERDCFCQIHRFS